MSNAWRIARDEWRFWQRGRLALAAASIAGVLVLVTLLATAQHMVSERASRDALQAKAEQAFREQPARHPHRMVHYGHYAFRRPAPLAVVDPGVDPYAGTVVFLEGHRQNSATFSPFYVAPKGGPFALLTPAITYQLLVPLLLAFVGFACLAREREAETDRLLLACAVRTRDLWLGKVLALGALAGVLTLPLAVVTLWAISLGEQPGAAAAFVLGYAAYLAVWVGLIVAVSARSARPANALFVLVALWLGVCVLLPRGLAMTAEAIAPTVGKLESDIAVTEALREVGDGHNAGDPAFNRLRANLLEQYNVHHVEDLPVNFRGVVAGEAEAAQTDILNDFAAERMSGERAQSRLVSVLSLVSPTAAVQRYSMSMAGTDLAHHHRFLRESEALRFDFVQKLNRLHAEGMSYQDDIQRSSDQSAEQRTRVSADNWRLLDDYTFRPAPVSVRVSRVAWPAAVLMLWALASAWIGLSGARALGGQSHA